MEFKFTTIKIITSIMFGLITILIFSYTIYTGSSGSMFVFSVGSVVDGFLIGSILVYLIYSLMQREEKK